MIKHYFPSQLKYYLLTQKKKPPEGFSFVETIVAMTILSIAFAINLQFLVLLKIENLNQEIKTSAVSLSKEILDGLRYELKSNLDNQNIKFRNRTTFFTNPGLTQLDLTDVEKKDFGGYGYKTKVYICKDQPTIDSANNVTCTNTAAKDIRHIVVQIFSPNIDTKTKTNELVYTAQTTFTTLQK